MSEPASSVRSRHGLKRVNSTGYFRLGPREGGKEHQGLQVPSFRYGGTHYRVEYTSSGIWGNPDLAAARAIVEPRVTRLNEQLFRTHHPSLATEQLVYTMVENHSRKSMWVILPTSNSRKLGLRAGDREIHILPAVNLDLSEIPIRIPERCDPFRKELNPRRILTPEDLELIRKVHVRAIGVEILVCGWAIYIFKTKKDMKKAWAEGGARAIGGLSVGHMTIEDNPCHATLQAGEPVSPEPDSYIAHSQLGLKIRLPGGIECITTVTHGFVKRPNPGPISVFVADRYKRFKRSLMGFRSNLSPSIARADVHTTKKMKNSPLGKVVYSAGTKTMIGHITTTFDNPSEHVPYPARYKHDLSLVTAPHLPDVFAPPGIHMAPVWAEYDDALEGEPVFEASLFLQYDKWKIMKGTVATEAVRLAVIEGTKYLWENEIGNPTISLLWRSEADGDDATGFSGSVLCLGTPTQKDVKPILFQNYARVIRNWPASEKSKPIGPCDTVKGGFFLPDIIRKSKILLSNQPGGTTNPVSEERRLIPDPLSDRTSNAKKNLMTDPV
ncbi:hypothetical protein DTO212C5_510 [Paecilomyces variotii]|nr:hypothetical protein DTO212C5_510 [Paecilomyces variotii]